MEMDIKNLNSVIAKRVIDPTKLKMGMFVSRIDYEGKKIENRYYISSITTKNIFTPFSKRKVGTRVIKVKCYDMIADEFVNFTGAALLNFMRPSETDFYDYQYMPVGENDFLKEDDYVIFMDPKKIQMTIKRGRPKHVFMIAKRHINKYGVCVNLIDGNSNYLLNVPVEFLIPVEFIDADDSEKFSKIKNVTKDDDEKPEVDKESYDKLEKFKNKVEDLKEKLQPSLDLPKEFLDNKKVNFGFSFSANDAGLKIDFYDEYHNSMSQTFIDFNKNDFDSINQMISKYVTALSMMMLNFNKINVKEKTIS